jgi:parallel beta-helix repeat protein
MAIRAFLFMGLISLVPATGLSTDYYVSNTHPQAIDANPGTLTRPIRTIAAAAKIAQGGDTIRIFAGTYRETVEFPHGGSGTRNPLIVRSMPGAQVAIKGSDRLTQWTPHAGAIWQRANWPVNSQQVFVDGLPLQQIGANCPLSRQTYQGKSYLPVIGTGLTDMRPGTFWYNVPTKTLYVWLTDNSDPGDHLIEASVRNWIIPPGPAGKGYGFIELHDLHFSHSNQTSQGNNMGMVNVWGSSWVVTGCTFTYGDFTGLNVFGEGHQITGNICNHNGAVGINLNGSDEAHHWRHYSGRPPQNIVLTGNETSFNNYRHFYMHWHAGGLRAAASCNAIQVWQHKAESNHAPGIWFDGWCRNIIINRCRVANNDGAGIFYEISDQAIIANNLVLGNKAQGIYAAAADGALIFNNTLVKNWAGIALHGMPRPEHPSLKNNKIRNNIISDSNYVDLIIYSHPATTAAETSDYNLYHRSDGSVRIAVTTSPSYDINYTDLRSFSSATGQERHSRNAVPLWANPAAGDYTLRSGSPAIDAGTNDLPEIGSLDYGGQKRVTAGRVKSTLAPVIDMGAYEFQ